MDGSDGSSLTSSAPDAARMTPLDAPEAASARVAAAQAKADTASKALIDSGRSSPLWWRRLMVMSRRANLFVWLEILAVIALVIAVVATYLAYTQDPDPSGALPTLQVSLLLMAILVPAMAILVFVGRRVALQRSAGSTARLHVRLVFFFSMVAAVPTLLVAGFAAFLFQTGVDFWFSDDSRGLMENANVLAQSYYDANQRDVQDETITMASDMRSILERYAISDPEFPDFYAYQAEARKISESLILQGLRVSTLGPCTPSTRFRSCYFYVRWSSGSSGGWGSF